MLSHKNLIQNILLIISFAFNNVFAEALKKSFVDDRQSPILCSNELKKLVEADQADRIQLQKNISESQKMQLWKKDLIRRKRVGEIFAEGCFKEAKDYLAGALVYQHGDTSNHYYQAYLWSKHAAKLGAMSGKSFSALAIDRYLISIGHKQLFGSQYQELANHCTCMQPVEQSAPDSFRKDYSGRTLADNYKIMNTIFNKPGCPQKIECNNSLKPTPKGFVSGLW